MTKDNGNQVWNQPTPSQTEAGNGPKERNWTERIAEALKPEPEPGAAHTADEAIAEKDRRITALSNALEEARQRRTTAVTDLAHTRAENGDLRTALQNTRIDLVAAQNSAIDSAKAVLALEAELTNAQNAYADAQLAIDSRERDLEALTADLLAAGEAQRKAENTIEQWRTAYDTQANHIHNMRVAADASTTAHLEALAEIDRLQYGEKLARQTIEEMAWQHKLGSARVNKLEEQLHAAQAYIDALVAYRQAARPWWHLW